MQNHFGLLDTDMMPICIIIALNMFIIIHFSINCSTVIFSPTLYLLLWEKPLVNTMPPRVYSTPYFQPYSFYFVALFAFRSHFAINLEGIDNPFIALGASSLCLCRYSGLDEILLLDWYLGSQTEGNTYCSCAASPFPLQGKNQRKQVSVNVSISGAVVWEVAEGFLAPLPGRISGAVAGEDQVKNSSK